MRCLCSMLESCKYCSPNGWQVELSNLVASNILGILKDIEDKDSNTLEMIKLLEREL